MSDNSAIRSPSADDRRQADRRHEELTRLSQRAGRARDQPASPVTWWSGLRPTGSSRWCPARLTAVTAPRHMRRSPSAATRQMRRRLGHPGPQTESRRAAISVAAMAFDSFWHTQEGSGACAPPPPRPTARRQGSNMPRLGASRIVAGHRDPKRRTHLDHAVVAETAEAVNQHTDRDAFDRVEVHSRPAWDRVRTR